MQQKFARKTSTLKKKGSKRFFRNSELQLAKGVKQKFQAVDASPIDTIPIGKYTKVWLFHFIKLRINNQMMIKCKFILIVQYVFPVVQTKYPFCSI